MEEVKKLGKADLYLLILKKCRDSSGAMDISFADVRKQVLKDTGHDFSKKFYYCMRNGGDTNTAYLQAKVLADWLEIPLESIKVQSSRTGKKLMTQKSKFEEREELAFETSKLARSFFNLPSVAKFIGLDE